MRSAAFVGFFIGFAAIEGIIHARMLMTTTYPRTETMSKASDIFGVAYSLVIIVWGTYVMRGS